jgi:hypothetical protein
VYEALSSERDRDRERAHERMLNKTKNMTRDIVGVVRDGDGVCDWLVCAEELLRQALKFEPAYTSS